MQGFAVSYDFIVEENNNERNNANENNEVFYGIGRDDNVCFYSHGVR